MGEVTELVKPRSEDPEVVSAFSRKFFDGKDKIECDACSTKVYHKAIACEKTAGNAVLHYENCPSYPEVPRGAASIVPLSKKEQRQWKEITDGLFGAMSGKPSKDHVFPKIEGLDQSKVIHLGDDEPYAVCYPGAVSFLSLLAEANDGWGELDDEPPFQEINTHYMFVKVTDGAYRLNVSPDVPGAELYTVVYWEDWRGWQKGH